MATLTVKVIEEITLNNNSYNSERSLDISSVDEIVKRIVTISQQKQDFWVLLPRLQLIYQKVI